MTAVISAVVAFGIGLAVGAIALARWSVRDRRAELGPRPVTVDWSHLVDLVRRAHGADAACLVTAGHDPVWAHGDTGQPGALLERALGVARLAMSDERQHVVGDSHPVVALGDGHHGIALAFDAGVDVSATVAAMMADLGRVLAELQSHRLRRLREHGDALPEWLVGGPDSVESVAVQLCEVAHRSSGRSCVLVLRDTATQTASVIAVSRGGDGRLTGLTVDPESAVGRACMSEVPIVSADGWGLFGREHGDRRRHDESGTAFPIWDGRECVGALVVFGLLPSSEAELAGQIQWLIRNASPRLGRAAALRAAEDRAMTDELTGLPNRRALEQAMHDRSKSPCSLLCVDIDHFKKLNDGFGHAAGDAALRHVAKVFRRTLRDGDVAARIGGEEFALWLPSAGPQVALEVAERVRRAVRESVLEYSGAELQLTCSLGVASMPDTVGHVDNLLGAADVALYRAKEAGRDRVEMAERRG